MGSRGVNRVILLGTLGKDPEVKFTQGGSAIARISVATNELWKDKNSGEQVEKTEWHRCIAFGKPAEIWQQYLHKGDQIYIEGQLETRKWQGQDGQDRYTTEIKVKDFQFVGSPAGGGDRKPSGQDNAGGAQQSLAAPPQDDGFDDIPFIDPYKFNWRAI